MITLKSIEHLFWRNRFSDYPVALAMIDPGDTSWPLSELPCDALPILADRFPTFRSGLVASTAEGLLATLCLSMQREKFDLPAVAGADRAQFWFSTVDQFYAYAAVNHAVAFLNWVTHRPQMTKAELGDAIREFVDDCEVAALDQSTLAMVARANVRSIPWFRIGHMRDIQLGQGRNQRRMHETLRSNESALAASYARDKALTCGLLSTVGLPVGKFAAARTPDEAALAAQAIGFPVVLKPNYGSKGSGVVIGLNNPQAVREAAEKLLPGAQQLLVQSFFPGEDHRILVVSGRVIAAARRQPAGVIGDGNRSIEQLIAAANADPRRGKGFTRLMNRIEIDNELHRVLAAQGYTLASVPHLGNVVRLRLTANISTGGTAVDVTDTIHPDNARLAERAALTVGLTVAGIDFITPDITRSWRQVGGAICEVNVTVGLRAHWLADPSRDVVGPILDTIFPAGDGRIPIALVTGTNGKTTTTRMLDHILRAQGHSVGSATTDGVTINGQAIVDGDLAGVSGASIVLCDPTVSAAVLETARGGVIKRGIYVDRCDVAALLNVDREQIEIDGIETLKDMARLKRKVLDTAGGAVVLNAQDAYCLQISRHFPVERTILFSLDSTKPDVQNHVATGGIVVTLVYLNGQETIVIRGPRVEIPILPVDSIPATRGGIVRFNVANALASVALAYGMKVSVETIAAGLSAFNLSIEHSPSRFNLVDGFPPRVLFDYACNPPALAAAIEAIDRLTCTGRRICAFTSPGNRPDRQIEDCGKTLAGHFDFYICFETIEFRRGRAEGEISRGLEHGLIAAGIREDQIASVTTQQRALAVAAKVAGPGDLLVVLGTDVRISIVDLRSAYGLPAVAIPAMESSAILSPGAAC
jgi:cyanophycin synthetase